MKYPAHIYAKALSEVIVDARGEDHDRIVENFVAFVRRNGDEAHLRKLVEEAARFTRKKAGIRKVTIEAARELGGAEKKRLKEFLKPGDVVEENIDPSLIAGVRIILNDEMQLDGSLKGKLDKMFT